MVVYERDGVKACLLVFLSNTGKYLAIYIGK